MASETDSKNLEVEEAKLKIDEMKLEGENQSNGVVEEEDEVNPWNVTSKSASGVDYDKLISK